MTRLSPSFITIRRLSTGLFGALVLLLAACAQVLSPAAPPRQYPGVDTETPTSTVPAAYPGMETATPITLVPTATLPQPGAATASASPGVTPFGTPGAPLFTSTLPPTAIPTTTPTRTPSGPTPTPTPTLLVLPGTPLPSLEPISASNAGLISGLAKFEIDQLTDLEWEREGKLLAAANPSSITLFEASSRTATAVLEAGPGVVDIAFSPDNVWLVSGGYVGSEQSGYKAQVQLWHGPGLRFTPTPVASPTPLRTITPTPTQTGTGAPGPSPAASPTPGPSPTAGTPQPSPTGATATNTPTGTPTSTATSESYPQPAFNPGAISGQAEHRDSGGSLQISDLFSLQTWLSAQPILTPAPEWESRGVLFIKRRPLSRITFTPAGESLVTAWSNPEIEPDNQVEFRSSLTWQITKVVTTTTVLDLAFSPDGSRMATAPHRYSVQVWDLDRRQPTLVFSTSFTGAVNSMAFSVDDNLLATGHYDGMIRIWDLASGDQRASFQVGGVVESLAFHPVEALLAAGISYPTYKPGQSGAPVVILSLDDPALVRTLTGHTNGVTRLAFSPDGSILASGSYDGSIWLWGIPER